jgi:uncharacterized membrane-anchored protein
MKAIHIFLIFLAVVLLQLFVPSKMIFDREVVLKMGTLYKFKTLPVDPIDPFRGKYVTLNYDLNTAQFMDSSLQRGDEILVYLATDSLGFAQLHSVSKKNISTDRDYVKAKVEWYNLKDNSVSFQLEFNRHYMEEFKAKPAEDIYRAYNRRLDTINKTYALVAVKDGEAVLKDVFINDKPILHYINTQDKK